MSNWIDKIYNFFDRSFGEKPKIVNPNPKTYKIWEHRGWGNSIFWFDFENKVLSGHLTPMIEVGDYILSKNRGNGTVFKYEIIKVDRMKDPIDMFFADAVYIGVEDVK